MALGVAKHSITVYEVIRMSSNCGGVRRGGSDSILDLDQSPQATGVLLGGACILDVG